jgi:hypothetical protein
MMDGLNTQLSALADIHNNNIGNLFHHTSQRRMRCSHAGDRYTVCLLQVFNKPVLKRLVVVNYANRNHLQNKWFDKLRVRLSERKMDQRGFGKEIGRENRCLTEAIDGCC